MTRVAISQSNYIPWKGYFDMIASVDQFVILDCVQFTRSDWRNRNKIKTPQGLLWLTVPVQSSGRFGQAIKDTKIIASSWAEQHWNSMLMNYRRAPFFCELAEVMAPIYKKNHIYLSELNRELMDAILAYLEIKTIIRDSSEFELPGDRNDRLVEICKSLGASEYISGPAAKVYLDENKFEQSGISVRYMDYSGYSPYSQLWGDFFHEVSVVDLLFNHGKRSSQYMKFCKND